MVAKLVVDIDVDVLYVVLTLSRHIEIIATSKGYEVVDA